MDRFVLLGLLALPVLIIMHVALFEQPLTASATTVWTDSPGAPRGLAYPQAALPERNSPSHFTTKTTQEKGS